MSGNFGESYIHVIESQQTYSWFKENAISGAVTANVFMLYIFCLISDGINFPKKFNLSKGCSYQVIHNVAS